MPPTLGFIKKIDRTRDQENAHDDAMQLIRPMARFGLPVKQLLPGQAVRLFDHWQNEDVKTDIGFAISRSHQYTGSCVNSGFWNALSTTIATQRVAADDPIEAFLPFTLHNYAMSRHYMGDDGEGEGSMGSTIAKSATVDGVRDWPVDRTDVMPDYQQDESQGVRVTSSDEMKWSSIRNPGVNDVLQVSRKRLVGSAAECKTVEDIQAAVQNGKGVTFACDNYIGNASIQGSGKDACVIGYWDGSGGHQQSILAIWNHPTLGMLYWAQNNWDANTYPRDPAGGPICGCWVLEKKVEAALRLDAEVYSISHVPGQPAMPKVLTWLM